MAGLLQMEFAFSARLIRPSRERVEVAAAMRGRINPSGRDWRGVFLDRRRNGRNDESEMLPQEGRRNGSFLNLWSDRRRRGVFALTGRDQGRSAFVMFADLVQFFV